MNGFDYSVLRFLNDIADAEPLFSKAVVSIYSNPLKTALISALIWYAWFAPSDANQQRVTRERLVSCVLGSAVCVAIVRLFAAILPFRARPIVNSESGLHFPIDPGGWMSWNAFPSDNAIMYSMVAACLYAISRPIGVLAGTVVAVLVLFPRVFLGVHHPTDILAGIFIGLLGARVVDSPGVRGRLASPVLAFAERRQALFAAAAFLLTFLLAEVYWPATSLLIDIAKAAKRLL